MTYIKLIKSFLSFFFAVLFLAGCAHRGERAERTEAAVNAKLHSPGSHVVSTIKFPLGQTKLTPAARTEIDKAVRLAQNNGEVEEVTVVVWSDQEFPAPGEKLPRAQVSLADKRGNEIENYLENRLNVDEVAIHNMAKQATYLGRAFGSADARLKQDLVKTGIAPVGDDIVSNRRSSTALIMVRAEED
jgi:hypothetical protein